MIPLGYALSAKRVEKLLSMKAYLLKTALAGLQHAPCQPGKMQTAAKGNQAGGIIGSAALKHEMEEVRQIEMAGRSVFNLGTIAAVEREFNDAIALGDPMKHIPYHMAALLAELEYARDKLAELGFKTNDLGVLARAIYGNLEGAALEKMEMELAELGYRWPDEVPPELNAAIRGQ